MIKVIPVFAMDEKKRILEALVHRGSITDSTRRTIPTVNNNVPATMGLGPIARDNDRDFISSWKVPAALILVLVCRELNRSVFAPIILEHLHGMLEDVSPTVICEDEIL